ncbi:hypothetical protein [Actinoplanes sp. NBRC 101535]|uniref:hypothetical protein n=1 Tax=Actinoplanes sp. NBRC 101535 TaxID=3032196 RepID=UPI00255629E7|nr:hypothetical protein [Actinoplanes sp. NBRC 101535]
MRTISDTAARAALKAILRGTLVVLLGRDAAMGTIQAYARNHWGDLVRSATADTRGRITHRTIGTRLNAAGCSQVRDWCLRNNHPIPDLIAKTTPQPTPRQSITRQADPLALIGAGTAPDLF